MSQLGDLDAWVRGRDSFKPLITVQKGLLMSQRIFSMTSCAKSGEHLSPIGSLVYSYLPKGMTIVHRFWLSLSNSKV